MVTSNHEATHRIFQEHPELVAPVFQLLGVRMPENAVVGAVTPDVTEIHPLERRIDGVFKVDEPDGRGFMLAVETQRRRDKDKAISWAYYLAYLKSKYRRPALLMVLCDNRATANWAKGPLALGPPGWTSLFVHPLVLGPGNTPLILDPDEASENLLVATFAAMTHAGSKNAPAILDALARALAKADKASAQYFGQWVELGLGDSPARKIWSDLMKVDDFFPHRQTLLGQALKEGRTQERAEMVLLTLAERHIAVSAEVRERILSCDDYDALGRYARKAFHVAAAHQLFDEDA
jgi:hypothetical protein